MRDRCRALAVVFVAALALIPVACQAPPSPTAVDTDTSLRTPWGEPDLQGIWTDTTATPLERPAQFAGQEFFTDAERAELDEQRAALRRFDTRSEAGTPLDVAGAYNAVYQSVKKTGRRTSLIVDPPDGRVPPLTAAGRQRVDADRRGRASFEELAGSYGTERMNRADGPEDRGRAERCLGNRLPALGGYSRIVGNPPDMWRSTMRPARAAAAIASSPSTGVSIFPHTFANGTGTRAADGRGIRSSSIPRISPPRRTIEGPARLCI